MVTKIEKDIFSLIRRIELLAIPEENKQLIRSFYNECRINKLKLKTIYSYLKPLHSLAKNIQKPFTDVTKEDLANFFVSLTDDGYNYTTPKGAFNGKYSDRTIELWGIVTKKFFKFIKCGNSNTKGPYPDCVSWIKPRAVNRFKLPEEMLTQEDIQKIINICDSERDKAMIMVLYESACRLGELLSVKLKNIEFDEYGFTMLVDGKTGQRPIRLVLSEPQIKKWLECHPDRNNPEAPLWVSIGRADFGEPINEPGIQKRVKVLARRAGIKKNVYCHLFRHSRLTELAEDFTESDLRIFAGWTGASDMPSVYVHRNSSHVENKYLRLYGKIKVKKQNILEPAKCPACEQINPAGSRFCMKCGIDFKNIEEIEKQKAVANNWMNKLIQIPEVREFLEKKLEELTNNQTNV